MNSKQKQLKNAVLLKQPRLDNHTVTHRAVTIEIFNLRFNLFQLEFFLKNSRVVFDRLETAVIKSSSRLTNDGFKHFLV
jgi:hypothetical protein